MFKRFFLKKINRYASRWVVLIIDIFSVSISFVFAYFVRFNASFDFETENLFLQAPVIAIISLISFLLVGSYKGIIRHTGTRDVFNVFLAATLLTTLTFFAVMINGMFGFFPNFTIPISIIIIHYLVNIFILTLSRFIFKAFFEVLTTELGDVKHALIYGAGDSGIITYGALNRDTKNNYEVVGFIDDDIRKINKKIDRIKIFSLDKITSDFIDKNNIDEIIISIQNVKPDRLLEITDYFIPFDVEVKIVPPLSTWIDGNLHANQIRDVKIEDLLDRAPILIDNPILQRDLNDKIILVTGAAGSIGSEISRQLCQYKHKLLVLVDQAESDLYELQQELIQNGIQNFKVIVADVRDDKRMELLFQELSPQKVFHAAAYKHVPLMEAIPCEAVKVNVIGTKTIADLSLKYNVERFVMV